jgi:hypothetical protein
MPQLVSSIVLAIGVAVLIGLIGQAIYMYSTLNQIEVALSDLHSYGLYIPNPVVARQFSEELFSLEQKSGLQLTPAARSMLVIPVLEALQLGPRGPDVLSDAWESIGLLFAEMREGEIEAEPRNLRTSSSVIRAFARRYCSIPPFCRPGH